MGELFKVISADIGRYHSINQSNTRVVFQNTYVQIATGAFVAKSLPNNVTGAGLPAQSLT